MSSKVNLIHENLIKIVFILRGPKNIKMLQYRFKPSC